jgi:hypothetical protein
MKISHEDLAITISTKMIDFTGALLKMSEHGLLEVLSPPEKID